MVEINNLTRSRIPVKKVKTAAEKFLLANKKAGYSLSIAFIGGRRMKKLNYKYRRKNQTTDILSFAGEEKDKYLGELAVDYQQIKKQARRFSHTADEELIFIIIHGLLHLLGHEDDTEKGRLEMARLGGEFIGKLKNKTYDKNKKIVKKL